MRLESYQVEWLKNYFRDNVSGNPIFELDEDKTLFKVFYDIKEYDVLFSSDIVVDLIKYGFHSPWFGITNEDKSKFEFAISTPDEWVEY